MGKGVFATRDIPVGEIIFAERPLLVVPCAITPFRKINPKDYSTEDYMKIMLFEWEQLLEAAAGRMDPERRAKLMALANCHLEDGSGPINGIVRTNGFSAGNLCDGDDTEPTGKYRAARLYSVVCDIGSRMNHRCVLFYFFRLAITKLFF